MPPSNDPGDISSMEMAIRVQDLNLTYGGCLQAKATVMKNLSMCVPRGYIYGLLGPSGCGKTSLMRCILGTLRPNSGTIEVFGVKPGSSKSKVPGPGVGYMPQDITLYTDLTILETLSYFARLSGMSRSEIAERSQFLIKFLNLPDQNRMIGKLSGGQMRRASLAVALIHKPPLLVLDEPTVGVDPLLRKSIWDHLTELSHKYRLTVLITTHYIEEAKDANLVGFMRDCKILDQDSPPNLLVRYGLPSLEAVFLHLCTHEEAKKAQNNEQSSEYSNVNNELIQVEEANQDKLTKVPSKPLNMLNMAKTPRERLSEVHSNPPPLHVSGMTTPQPETVVGSEVSASNVVPQSKTSISEKKHRTQDPDKISNNPPFRQCVTMVLKNLRSLIRSPGYLLFQFLLPMIEAILFCASLGRDLNHIPLGIYDGDQTDFSKAIVGNLSENSVLTTTMYSNESSVIESVHNGTESTAVVIYHNFEKCLIARMLNTNSTYLCNYTQVEKLHISTIQLFPDMSNQLMVKFVLREVITTMQNVSRSFLDKNHHPELKAYVDFPVNMSTPIYGTTDQPFIDYMAPGAILSIAYFAAISLTTMNLVIERIHGLLERTNVVGVSVLVILCSHMLAYCTVLLVQVVLLLAVVLWWFAIPFYGSLALMALLTFLQSVCGMMMGLFISSISDTENTATMLAIGLFYPALLLSGTMWPLNAMSPWLHTFSLILPQTVPIESMRILMIRGWGLSHWATASGFVVTLIWIAIYLIASIVAIRIRQY